MTTTDERTAIEQGNADAIRLVTTAYAGGLSLDAIEQRMADSAASMLNDAQTGTGRAFAAAYDDTARDMISELRADADAAANGRSANEKAPRAAGLAQGTPHADPALAAKGWQSDGRAYVRREPVADREAG